MTLRATLDGVQLTSYVDTSVNPVLAGRVALVSGYYNTRYDNLAVTPIKGQPWKSEAGFAHFNRTQHVLGAGQSLALDFTGTGLNLFGATAAAALEVRIDDQVTRTEQVGTVGTRQTSYWLRGLPQRRHSVTVRVVSGTFTLDGIDVLSREAHWH